MEKIFKKSLAVVVATALCLTAFIGCLTASALSTAGTLEVGTVEVAAGAETAVVPITLATSDTHGIAAAVFDLSYDNTALAFSEISEPDTFTVDVARNADKSAKVTTDGTTDTVRVIVEAGSDMTFDTVTVNVTFTVKAAAAAGDHAVAASNQTACHAGDYTMDGDKKIFSPNEDYVVLTLTDGKVVIANSHEHSYGNWTSISDTQHTGTCTAAGCTDPAATLTEDHTFGEGVQTTAPTCENAGVMSYTCTKCGFVKTEAISVLDHTPVEVAEVPATCTEAGTTAGHKCSVCNAIIDGCEVIPALGHSFGDWTITAQPTATATGSKTRTCSVCGETETEVIPVAQATTAVRFATPDLLIQEKVAIRLRVLKNTFATSGYSDFFVNVDYDCYVPATNYSLKSDVEKIDYSSFTAASATVDATVFAVQAMYEINLPLKATAYFKDADGVVVAYTEIFNTNVKDLILSRISTWNDNTKTQGIDLVNYATALQNNFAAGALATAEKINADFTDYQSYASTQTEFSYNATFERDTDANIAVAMDYIPGASNNIRFRPRINTAAFDMSKLTMTVSYQNGFTNTAVTVPDIMVSELDVVGGSTALPVYAYLFNQLALYDFNKTVTATIYYEGTPIYDASYCLEYYVFNHLDPAGANYAATSTLEREALTAAMRFAASSRVAFGIAE